MASGNTLCVFTALDNEPPSASYATADSRNAHPCLDFDATADESAVFRGVLPRHYSGGSLTVTLIWAATSATTGACRWAVSIERDDTGLDMDADSFATAVTAGASAPGTSGAPAYTAIVMTVDSPTDGLVAGEMFRLKVTRDADGTSGTDDMAGDAELYGVEIKET